MLDKAARIIRRFCLDCQGGHGPSVSLCADTACLLHPFRDNLSGEKTLATRAERPLRLIRCFCLVCAGNRQEARICDAKEKCALWRYRFGVLPATFKRVTTRRRRWQQELTLPGIARRSM